MVDYVKRGYVNNPNWVGTPSDRHSPCGYWYKNATLYSSESTYTYKMGTAWVQKTSVNPSAPRGRLVSYEGSLYGFVYGDLYRWNDVDDWVLVASGYTGYESYAAAAGEYLYGIVGIIGGYEIRRYKTGDSSWTLVASIGYTYGIFRGATEFNGVLYLGTANCKLVRLIGSSLTVVADYGVSGNLMGFCELDNKLYACVSTSTGIYSSKGDLLEWNGVNAWTKRADGYVYSGNIMDTMDIVVYHGEIYGFCRKGTSSSTYRIIVKWNGTDAWEFVRYDAGLANIYAPQAMVYYEDNVYAITGGALFKYNESFSDVANVAPSPDINVSGTITRYNDKIYTIINGKLYEWGVEITETEHIVGLSGTDAPDDSVWPFKKQTTKLGYQNNPNWVQDATSVHTPCGYWYENDTLYRTVTTTEIVQGTEWEVIARNVRNVSGAPRLMQYEGDLYAIINNALYKWNGANEWVEVVSSLGTGYMIYSAIVFEGYIYAGFQDNSLRKWQVGDATWALVSSKGSSSSAYRPAELVIHDNSLYVLSTDNGNIMDSSFNVLATFNYWSLDIYGISYDGYLWIIPYNTTAGREGVWKYESGSLTKEFESPTGWRYMNGGFDECYDRLYTLYRHDTVSPRYRLHYHTQSGGSLDSTEVGYNVLYIPYGTQGACLIVYKDLLYHMDYEGSLYLIEEEETGTKVAEGIVDPDWGTCVLSNKSYSEYNDSLYIVTSNGVLLRFTATEVTTTTTEGVKGYDSPNTSVWPFDAQPDKPISNEGDELATYANPIWENEAGDSIGDAITPAHIPCGYWCKFPYTPPAPNPPPDKWIVLTDGLPGTYRGVEIIDDLAYIAIYTTEAKHQLFKWKESYSLPIAVTNPSESQYTGGELPPVTALVRGAIYTITSLSNPIYRYNPSIDNDWYEVLSYSQYMELLGIGNILLGKKFSSIDLIQDNGSILGFCGYEGKGRLLYYESGSMIIDFARASYTSRVYERALSDGAVLFTHSASFGDIHNCAISNGVIYAVSSSIANSYTTIKSANIQTSDAFESELSDTSFSARGLLRDFEEDLFTISYAGDLYRLDTTTPKWDKVADAPSMTGTVSGADLFEFNNRLYGIFNDTTGLRICKWD